MLRQPKSLLESRWAPATRRFSLVVLLLAGVLVCGVRTSPQQQAVAQPKSAIVERKVISLDPKWLMSDVDVFLKVQPGVLTTKPEFRELLAQVSELMAGSTTLHLENIEAAWSMFSFKDESMIWIVRTKEPHTLLADPDTETKEYRGHTIVPASKNRFGILVVDNRTLIIAAQPRQLGPYIDAISSNRPRPDWWNRWSKLPPHTVTIYADVEAITRSLPERAIDEGPFVAFAPVFRESEDVFVVLDLEDKTKLAARIKTGSKDSAARVRRTVDASVQLAQNMLDQFRGKLPEIPDARMREPMRRSLNMLGQLLASSKVSVKGVNVQLRASAGDGGGVALAVAAAMPAVAAAREAARRVQGINNMKQLGLALLIYESDHRHFPPAVLKKEGSKYPYSWRVAILPFIERPDLYKRYRFDEPWDSKNNKELLAEIPELYKSPVDTREGGYTSYFAPIGERTILNSEEGTRIRDVKDGTSNTILLVEAKREIPWTKPEDIDIDEQSISLGGWHAGDIFIAGFADGSVRTISNAVDPKMLQHLFDMKDGQDVNP